MPDESNPWLVLAHLLRPQGRKGELLAELLTDFPERFETHPRCFLAAPAFAGPEEEPRTAEILSFWLPVGRNQGRIVLHFAGVESIEAAEALAGLDVLIPQSERPPLEDDATYISDLLGCTVYAVQPESSQPNPRFVGSLDQAGDSADPGTVNAVGVITDVQFPTTPDGARRLDEAAPLLAVTLPDGQEALIPFVKAFLVRLDIPSKTMLLRLPEGLLEINTAR